MAVTIKKVGVIGSGQMGNGIAHVAALAGYDVVLNDLSSERLKSAMATINGNLSRQVSKKLITEDARKQALDRIVSAETLDGLADCDLVIETAVEKEEVKRKIFHDLCAVLKPEAIVASNSSSISITRLAAVHRPPRAIYRHSLHEPGAADGAGRTDPRHRDRRRDLRFGQGLREAGSASTSRRIGRFPGVHRQSHPAADDQRGRLHAV